jgi:PAS domain S-box-containing protein
LKHGKQADAGVYALSAGAYHHYGPVTEEARMSWWGALPALRRLRARLPSHEAGAAGELEAVTSLSVALGRARDAGAVAQLLVDSVTHLLGLDFAALTLVGEDGRSAHGFLARGERDVAWWSEIEVDLVNEPSGIASAVFEAAPVVVYDVERSEQVSRRLAARVGAKSAIFVPLIAEERVIAVLVCATTGELRAFTAEETRLVHALAAEAALALDRARSADALQTALRENERRLAQQSALLRAAQVLASDLRLETVLQRLVEQLAELVDGDAADCYLYDPARGTLRCAAVYGLSSELLGFEFDATKGVAAEAIRTGRPAIGDAYGDLADPVPHEAYAGFVGAIVAPMRWGEETQGVLGVGVRDERRLTPEDAEVLDAFAVLASLALRNAETFEERTRQARVERGFYRIASVLAQSLSLPQTLDAVAQAAAEALGGKFAAVLMPGTAALDLAGAYGLPRELRDAFAEGLPESASCLAGAATDSRVLASGSIADDDRFEKEWREVAARTGYSALLAVPVSASRTATGGVVVVFFESPRTFSHEDLELARHLADATLGALERSELFEGERAARALAQQLARTGSLLATELDPAAVLDEVVTQAPALVSADACAIRVLEGDELVVSAVQGERTDAIVGARAPSSGWLSGDVVQSRTPMAVADAGEDSRLLDADPVLALGYRSYLGVPLVGPEGHLHGALAVYARRPRTWRDEEIEALTALAVNTAAALSNAELYQRVALENERSFAILGNVADGIVAVDRDGKVVLWNAAAARITGVPADEAIGRTPFQVLRRHLEAPGDAATGDRLVSIPRGDGEVWLSLTEAVMHDPAGAVAGRIFTFRDISADRLVEQMKTNFVATVSHELRTPLTSIYGFAETLLREDVHFGEQERTTFLRYIASESERLTAIVDALLNVARLDTGDLQVNLAPIDVASLVTEVVQGVEETVGGNAHRFVVDVPAEPLAAEADADKLRQVCSILVENAVKYSPNGGTVTVEARRRSDRVEVRVIDQGVGIPEAEQERIFRKFYRAGNGDERGGTGLGLFIAQGLVSAMGGRIWVSSAEGEGSSFVFELPAAGA